MKGAETNGPPRPAFSLERRDNVTAGTVRRNHARLHLLQHGGGRRD
jgi:hypothetical protein